MISRRMGNSIENARSSHFHQRLTADNSLLVLIDYQIGHLLTIRTLTVHFDAQMDHQGVNDVLPNIENISDFYGKS